MNQFQQFIALSKYARWLPHEGRRETWAESVDRYIDFFSNRVIVEPEVQGNAPWVELEKAIINMEVMPSMRCMMTAGKALDRDNIAGYNCTGVAINHPRCFDEIFYILMNGCGVGFSVERQYINQLPEVSEDFYDSDSVIKVRDSKIGWASALRELIGMLYSGRIPSWDTSGVRPAGARLKTFGGRACLTGDTILYKDRKKSRVENEITIKDLYDLERGLGKWKGVPNHFRSVKLRCLDESTGQFYRNKVLTVVDNGLANTTLITTENGYTIKATSNHRFLDETGTWKFLSEFKVGDLIATNGSKEKKTGICIDCGKSISRRAQRCKACFDEYQTSGSALDVTARQRKICRDYRKSTNVCERCGIDKVRLVVHHKDHNPQNNMHTNLEVLCETCHQRHHASLRTATDPYSHRYLSYDKIVSLDFNGVERVYDLQMQAPDHNFVANGFVSHNSGPEPLEKLFKYTTNLFRKSKGRKLNSLECHDLVCMIADTVIVGSVRRSACISLSNLTDDRMRRCKTGQWWLTEPQRALANISVAYTEKPDLDAFSKEMRSMHKSRAGERGVINLEALKTKAGLTGRNDNYEGEYLLNPCGEAILRASGQCCNLTEVVVRSQDTLEILKEKVRLATILGTLQSTLTDFRYLRNVWKTNAEEERLLGVSLTGIMDHETLSGGYQGVIKGEMYKAGDLTQWQWEESSYNVLPELLCSLKQVAIETNKEWAEKLGINPSKQLTLIKPSGTVSQLVDSASGIHPRMFPYYKRNVRQDKKDPISQLMIDQGVPYVEHQDKYVFSFPIKAPENAVTSDNVNTLSQLELWKVYREHWCDGNPSQTIYYTDDEYFDLCAWVWRNWDLIGGLSFFPKDDHIYELPPYEKITEEEYERLSTSFPVIDWSKLGEYEQDDQTTSSQELSCSGGQCEL